MRCMLLFPSIALAAFLSACGPARCDSVLDCPDVYRYQCSAENVCESLLCESDADCDVGERCNDDRCEAPPRACATDAECTSTVCAGSPWPACTTVTGHCTDAGTCG